MENKQLKRRWKISVLLVSAICILLASSFIFSIGVEALTYDYDLQTMYFQAPVDRDGKPLSSVDTSLIVQQSVTENNTFAEGTVQKSGISLPSGWLRQDYVQDGYFLEDSSTGDVSLVSPYQTKTYLSNGLRIGFASLDLCFKTDSSRGYYYIYNSNDELVFTRGYDAYWSCFGLYELNGYYYVFYSRRSSSSGTASYGVELIDKSTLQYVSYYSSVIEAYSSVYVISGKFYILKSNGVYIWDGLSQFPTSPTVSFPSGLNSANWTISRRVGNFFYLIGTVGSYTNFYYLTENGFEISFSVSSLGTISNSYFCAFVGGAWLIHSSTSDVILSEYPDFTYDLSQYVGNSFTPSRWLNFSLRNDATGAFTGGYHVGIELDFGVSPLMYNQVGLKGFNVGVTTLIASDFMIESETTMTAPRPLNAWIGSEYVTSYDTHYSFIGQRDGKYLYMCSSVCNFSSQARLNAVKIVVNCYIPFQVSSHSFSLPVSIFSLSDEYSGGGGGESSDTSSGGGGSISSDLSSGGTSSEDHPSDMPPEWERNSVEFWFKNQTQDFFLGTYDMWDADTLQVYFGGYAVGSMQPVPTRIRFLKNDVVTEEIRFENLVFQGWSYSSSLSSFEYPIFSGQFVTVPLDSSRRIYLTDYLSNPQLFIADYGAGMLALVNFDSTDSYLTVVNSETLETTITVNNSSVESMIIYGKVMEYSFFTLSEYISWQPYEEGGVYIHANDWDLYDDVYAGLYLHTYITETPPPTVDWWVEYSMELEAERSRLAELESKANQLYGDVSYDPLDDAGFVDAVSSYTGVIATDAADGVFSLIQKMWSANPYFSYFVAITVGISCCMFYLRKL